MWEMVLETVTMPYEFLSLSQTGEKGVALDRSGKRVYVDCATQCHGI